MDSEKFTWNLVKGRIAETVFAQMLRKTRKFTVLEFGYEKIIPELAQQGETKELEALKTAPDFAVINNVTKEVTLIEVKYRSTLNYIKILEIAQRMSQSWNPSSLFIATPKGFFFDDIKTIITNKGRISPLKHPMLSEKLQDQYLQILTAFEKNN